jgi:hypothetical protein
MSVPGNSQSLIASLVSLVAMAITAVLMFANISKPLLS